MYSCLPARTSTLQLPLDKLAVVMLQSSCEEVSSLQAGPLQWDAINTTESRERAWTCCQDADWLRRQKVSSAL